MAEQAENPTQSGDSIQERLESYLSPDEPKKPQAEAQQETPQAEAAPETNDEPESDESDSESEPQLSTTDLAKYLGIDESLLDVDELGALNLKTKVDGEEGKAKLSDLIASYQLRAHVDKESRAVADQRKAFEAQVNEYHQQLAARAQQVEDLVAAAQHELNREFQNVDWQTLRVTDPAEYAASLQDYQARQAHINNIANQANQQRQQFSAKQQQDQAAFLQEQAKALPTLIPEWSDPVVADKERGEIRDFAISLGIPKDDVDSISHATHVAILRKAMLYDRMQTSKTAMEKKVVSAPKLVKPGQTTPRNSNETSVNNLRANVRKSGGKLGVEEYLLATGKV
jgi:hypothetical protein